MSKITDLLDLSKRMDERKAPWLEYWQQLGDILLPNKADFTRAARTARARTDIIYDGTPRLAAQSLANTVDGLTMPKTNRWFWLTMDDPEIAELDEVKFWLDDTAERMWAAVYRKAARFIQRTAETTTSLVVFGTAAMFIGERRDMSGLMFKSFHLRDFAIDENADGQTDRFKVDEHLKPSQAIGKWGEENMHPEVMKLAKDSKHANTDLCFTQIILPSDDYDADKLDTRGMPFKSCVIDVKHEHEVTRSGFHEFPVAIPRWETAPDELYGRSPGMMALPDAKTLQAMGKTLLIAGQKAVDPPTWAYNEAVISPIRTYPGGHITLDGTAAQSLGGGAPIGVLEMGKNMPLGLDMQVAVRQQVEAAFFKNLFTLPDDTRMRTATEILARKEEYQRTIGPVFGRMESDYVGFIVERVFNIMHRAGQFLPFPELPDDREVRLRFEYLSPIQQARKQTELAAFGQSLMVLEPLAAVQPEILDNFDGDEIARDLPMAGGFTQKWLRPKEQVEERRAQRAQQAELAQAAEAAPGVAGAVKDLASAGDIGAAQGAV
jgi:hypothetical protein